MLIQIYQWLFHMRFIPRRRDLLTEILGMERWIWFIPRWRGLVGGLPGGGSGEDAEYGRYGA